ncbi:hypothetical protein N7492_000477 [Penicillium capsulatum]|uniref:Bacteriophage T5 Orf172 DNA-binding domain-containing protein n=1 Tax=Penicillium capsulatum TaxID=69766 RepID=A0A9W9LYK4_9EURO|nr:hypothetical protein N7492_000477 [Penicillium capsulatum]KAJ6130464.1 hypothetical protein N7512_003244 [Penicillium capsulatum]
MPQISNTPEALLPRSDSRNPATTCRGITTQGRPCRRALAASQNPSPITTPKKKAHEIPDMSSLYCWQHKDQATPPTLPNDPNISAKPRTSIDTLMDRLGVLEIKDEPGRRRTNQNGLGEKRRPRRKRTFCCFEMIDEDSGEDPVRSVPVQRPVQRPSQSRPTSSTPQGPQKIPRPHPGRMPSSSQRVSAAPHGSPRPLVSARRKSSASSQTQSLLSWIPSTLSPQTTSLLLTELAKPISEADEAGFIYIFWVTPRSTTRSAVESPPAGDIASSLVPSVPASSSGLRPPAQSRSISDALQAARELNALTSYPTSDGPGSVRLKIGRTSNVHRRLNEWTRQCSHDLTLIRYYPYTPSSSTSSPARGLQSRKALNSHLVPGRKVPHVHRVERLIHLELTDLRVRDLGQCRDCGKEHREWFEVEAAKEALRRVDECVRRWISWGESMG